MRMNNKIRILALLLGALSFVVSCNETEFSANGKKEDSNSEGRDGNGRFSENGFVIDGSEGEALDKFLGRTDLKNKKNVDVIFLVDTSGSMRSEKKYLEENIATFVEIIDKDNRLNQNIHMIGANFRFPVGQDPEKFSLVNTNVGSRNALEIFTRFVDNPDPNALQLRKDATKEIVVVSDDDSRMGSSQFVNYLDANKEKIGNIHLNGFVGKADSQENSWCRIAQIGNVYKEIAENKDYGGTLFDLCTEDWKVLLDDLAKQIIASNTKISFALKNTVKNPESIEVYLNEKTEATFIPEELWSFDTEKNAVVFKDFKYAPKSGEILYIQYLKENLGVYK